MAAALIPVKSLGKGKTRLSATFSAAQRHELTLAMLEDVLAATMEAGLWPVTVVSADAGVLSVAGARGARGLVEPEGTEGLNGAVEHGLAALERHGAERVIVLLPDVPTVQAQDLQAIEQLLDDHQVVVVPSTDGGTNVLGLRLPAAVRAAFGPDSAARYSQAAWLAEVFLAVRTFESLRFDLDEPEDVEHFLETGHGGQTRQALARFGRTAPVARAEFVGGEGGRRPEPNVPR